jgi:proline iminopeptidase
VDAVRGNLKHHTFILFDQRGSLLSPVPDSLVRNLTLDMLVEDVETLRKALGQDKITLFGHSFGTLLAIGYFRKYPEHVRSIILTASVPPFVTPEKPFGSVLAGIRERSRALRTRKAVEDAIGKAGLSEKKPGGLTPRQSSDLFKIKGLAAMNIYHIEKWMDFIGGNVYYNPDVDDAIGSSMPEYWDIRPLLQKFPVPVTVIQGDSDYIDPSASEWAKLEDDFDVVKIRIVSQACHYSWIDDKKAFDRYLKYALDRE